MAQQQIEFLSLTASRNDSLKQGSEPQVNDANFIFFSLCYNDEKMLFSFSLDSDSIFGKIAPCQLLRRNFKNKSDFLAMISRLNCPPLPDSVPVELH